MDVAIIGISGRFPEAPSLLEFYQNLCLGKDSVKVPSRARLVNTGIDINKKYRKAGYLDNIDLFDHDFFGYSFGEAQNMDPHQRLLLEVVYETFENAGYNVDFFNGSATSVYLGDTSLNYYELASEFDPTLLTGNLNAIVAGKIARFFNLRGNAQMIDTSCSSSLVALYSAVNELTLGEAEYALVCGAHINLFPLEEINDFNTLGILSPDGKAKAFSDMANGTVSGEAVACVLLKPLVKAIADHDVIHAVIKGVAVNQDAALSGSITAPSSLAQSEVIKRAWQKAGVEPESISFIEAHGTGTKLGDPIEVEGIDGAFREFTNKKQFCPISSLKTNIGHTNSAAGICSLVKLALSLKFQKLFPSLHFDNPNPFIDFKDSAVYVNTKLKNWPTNGLQSRRGGISSFGLSGTNCHAVLEEAPLNPTALEGTQFNQSSFLITVSAKNQKSLIANIRNLKYHLAATSESSVGDISYTLNKGRKHYACRYAAVVETKEQLIQNLNFEIANDFSEKLKEEKTAVFIFSGRITEPQQLLVNFIETDPEFKTIYENSVAGISPSLEQDATATFLFQLCFHKLLEKRGITSKFLLGNGIGEITVAVITGKISFDQGLQDVLSGSFEIENDISDRCRKLVQMFKNQSVIYVEVGSLGSITECLGQLDQGRLSQKIVSLKSDSKHKFLNYLKNLYLLNVKIDWEAFYNGREQQRLELPSYQFNNRRCWYERDQKPATLANWFYEQSWSIAVLENPVPVEPGKKYLIFTNLKYAEPQLVTELRANGNTCICVQTGSHFRLISKDTYQIGQAEEDYVSLKKELDTANVKISAIIRLDGLPDAGSESADTSLNQIFSQLYLFKAFDEILTKEKILYLTVTWRARKILSTDVPLNPAAACTHGFLISAAKEYPLLTPKCIDTDMDREADLVLPILAELAEPENQPVNIAYRKQTRYISSITSLPQQLDATNGFAIRPGIYLITGGASGIGLEMVKYFGNHQNIKLAVIGRRNLPPHDQWKYPGTDADEKYSDTIREFNILEERGTEILYFAADLGDKGRLEEIVEEIHQKWGAINGVIHAAGVPGKKRIRNHTAESFNESLAAKVSGTIHLASLISDPLDFFVLFSSLNSIIGAERNSNYSAANIFMDEYVHGLIDKGIPATVINWTGWSETGMLHRVRQSYPEQLVVDQADLTINEGVEAFKFILGLQQPQIFVSKGDPGLLMPIYSEYHDSAEAVSSPFSSAATHTLKDIGGFRETPLKEPLKYVNPSWSGTENKIANIWLGILKCDQIGLEDDFFDLGGHSLNGAQVINRIEQEFGLQMEFEMLFDYATIKSLAHEVDELRGQHQVTLSRIEPIPVASHYELSHAQKRLWVMHSLEKQTAYNFLIAFSLEGELNLPALKHAFSILIQRHEILRTNIRIINGELKQQIADQGPFEIDYVDIRSEGNKNEIVKRLMFEEEVKPFDLSNHSLLRINLLRTEETTHALLFTIHHIISDDWSMQIMINELVAIYNGFCNGEPPVLPALRIQYKDYASWHNHQLAEDVEHRKYWSDLFKDNLPLLDLPTDYPRPDVKSLRGSGVLFNLDSLLVKELLALNKDKEVSLFMTLLATVNILLYRYSSQNEIIVGSPVAGRDHLDLEGQIGFYVNMLALKTTVSGTDRFEQLLQQTKKNTLTAFQHQIFPFDELVKEVKQNRQPNRSPIFDVEVELNRSLEIDSEMTNIEITQIEKPERMCFYDLIFTFNESSSGIQLLIRYNSDLFRQESIQKLGSRFQKILGAVVREPRILVSEIELDELQPAMATSDLVTSFNFASLT